MSPSPAWTALPATVSASPSANWERRYPRCVAGERQRWLAPVLQHLDALQRIEYRYNHGADPVEAEHSLPAAADSAYDLARRGLWEAERQMAMCRA